MAAYEFVSVWKFDASIEDVGNAIADVMKWPTWWKAVKSVRLLEKGVGEYWLGAVYKHVWSSPLPYAIEFDIEIIDVVPYKRLAGRASGDLIGTGVWTLEEKDGVTTATYEWKVRTSKLWMNLIAPLAKPIFKWAHNKVMDQGERGLKKLLLAGHPQKPTPHED
jgi:hypothetical protein